LLANAAEYINKIVTLGTPHRGITFQVLKDWIRIDAEEELEHFNPKRQADTNNPAAYVNFSERFPPNRVLTVVGTNYRTYGTTVASWMNRLFSAAEEFGPNYNRSDGLVKQVSAQLPGAPRTFVHKCHGGPDSLVTSREAFEIATRFFFGIFVFGFTSSARRFCEGVTSLGAASSSSVSRSSRAGSISTCSIRAPRPRTATDPFTKRISVIRLSPSTGPARIV